MGKFLSVIWRIIGILSVLVITCFIWLYFFVPKPETISTSYVNSLTAFDGEDTALEDSTIVLDIQLMKNADNSGEKLFEVAFTTYQGENTDEIFTKGVQVVGDFNTSVYRSHRTTKWKFWILETYNIWYDISIDNLYSYDISYDKGAGIAYASPTSLNNSSSFIVSVGNGENMRLAKLEFKNEVVDDKYYVGKGYESSSIIPYDSIYSLCGLNYMLSAIYNSVNSLNAGTSYITFDLSEFFNVYIQDDDGQYNILTQDTQFTYVTARVNVEDNGITTRTQSMFGMVAENDGSISFEIDDSEKLFWKAYENVYITDCFDTRESSYYNGTLLSINNETITKYKDYENLRIHLTIDLSKYENVIGIDAFGLDGLNYYDITIIGGSQDFYFMSNSLTNTKVNNIYHSDNINVVIYDDVDVNVKAVA
ncbi:MAG TPA: hypothetical protein IAB72_02965 [Candidatus Onthoplasma faecipullorum]|nr:hypothetical protein [Candidatus Onthoplasma faecipullorum]